MDGLTLQQLTGEQRFQLFLESTSDYAIFFTDPKGVIVEWNNGAEKMIGFSEAEALGQNARMIFTAADQAAGVPEREMAEAVRAGLANDERWHVRKSQARFFATGRMVALKNEEGHVFGFAKIIRDATPYKSLEEALRLSEEQYRLIFTQAPLGMMVIDLEGRIVQANAAQGELLGYSFEELRGRVALSLTSPQDQAQVAEQIKHLFSADGATFAIEKRMVRANGTYVWVRNSAAVLRDGRGRPVSVIDLCQDISLLKLSREEMEKIVENRTLALREKTKQMESFCYTVAHDLRAPLRSIAGYAEFLALDYAASLDPNALQYLQKIEAGAERLDQLMHDLLGYTRAQQIPLTPEQVDLSSVLRRVMTQLHRDVESTSATIQIREPLPVVAADNAALEHVFLNLVSNALKFRRADAAPLITIFAEDQGERVRIWIEDNGIGVDPRFAERVFRIFERVHEHQKYPGTGIGLAIVATVMDRLGGKYGVEPNHNGGSRFWIDFQK